MRKALISLVVIVALTISNQANASPGGTNSQGCHACRTNCARYGLETGERHCHERIAPTSQKVAAVTMTKSAGSTNETKQNNTPFFVLIAALIVAAALVAQKHLRPN